MGKWIKHGAVERAVLRPTRRAIMSDRSMSDLRADARRLHCIREGQEIPLVYKSADSILSDSKRKKIDDFKVIGVYPLFITLRHPKGFCITMRWDEFQEARAEADRMLR